MNASDRIAVLDVDGTLIPGQLGVELLRALLADRICDKGWAESIFASLAEYRHGRIDLSTMARRAYPAFARALAGREVSVIEAHAKRVWATKRGELFAFVPELLALLRSHGYELMLISGGPIEMVRLIGDELEIAGAFGAVFTRRDGRYTGEVELTPGVPGHKQRIFTSAIRGRAVNLARCFALSDSQADLGLFDLVGAALVFEPEPKLAALAAGCGLPIATRADVVDKTRALLMSPQGSRPQSLRVPS